MFVFLVILVIPVVKPVTIRHEVQITFQELYNKLFVR